MPGVKAALMLCNDGLTLICKRDILQLLNRTFVALTSEEKLYIEL